MRRHFLILASTWLLSACAMRLKADGEKETVLDARYLVKTDIDRVVDTVRDEVLIGLRRFAEKLYRRNPREWKKGEQPSVALAVSRIFVWPQVDFVELGGLREEAAAMAFRDEYTGDRVLALMVGLVSMVYAAFENQASFYLFDHLNEQKLYNCARNLEIAMWKLSSTRTTAGDLLLLSNELDPNNRNLSFEREFGRVVGLLDFLAKVVADKHGRTLSRVAQGIASMVFLPVSALGALVR